MLLDDVRLKRALFRWKNLAHSTEMHLSVAALSLCLCVEKCKSDKKNKIGCTISCCPKPRYKLLFCT